MTSVTCIFPVPAGPGLDLLCSRAESFGAAVLRGPDGAEIQAARGRITARSVAAGLEIVITSDADADRDILRAALDGFAVQGGMAPLDWRPAEGPARGPGRLIAARLLSRTRISPSYWRVRLEGDFSAFARGGLHFRLLLGPPGADRPVPNEAGGIDWPGGIDAWHRPPYTVRAIGPAAEWIDFDIFIHEGGRVTEWCDEARPGDSVMLTGPGGRGVRQAGWMGMVGDETALPVLLRAIEAAAPAARGQALILITDPADAQPAAPPPGLELRWIVRDGRTGLLDLLRRLQPPPRDRSIFFAGERAEAEAARLHAAETGFGAGEFHAAAYWTAGWVPPASQRQSKRVSAAGGG